MEGNHNHRAHTGEHIIPAIMPTSYQDLEFKAASVKGAVRRVQIDIMDGIFVPSLSWPFKKPSKGVVLSTDPDDVAPDHLDSHFRDIQKEHKGLPFWEDFDFEVDLMVENPAKAVDEWASTGVNRVILHVRDGNVNHVAVAIEVAKERSLDITLAILPTEMSETVRHFIFEKHLDDISGIQFMGIAKVGYQREKMEQKIFDTIDQVLHALDAANEKRKAEGKDEKILELSVDGGVNHDNARPLHDAGIDVLVSGSAIFDADSPRQALDFYEEVLI